MTKPAERIQVVPAELERATAAVRNTAHTVSNAGGDLAAGAVGEHGCDPVAQPAFAAMQSAWARQVAFLMASVGGLQAALGGAASAYPANDNAQLVDVWLPAGQEPKR